VRTAVTHFAYDNGTRVYADAKAMRGNQFTRQFTAKLFDTVNHSLEARNACRQAV
jgi:hypothetical protein